MTAISPKNINGVWTSGYALDVHTVSSICIGHDGYGHPIFDTQYTELGSALNQLKYRGDLSKVRIIAKALADFVKSSKWKIDLIIPVPPTRKRKDQPVGLIADGLSDLLKVPLCGNCITKTKNITELKSETDPVKRRKLLKGAYAVKDSMIRSARNILIIDDLYRSGATMNEIALTINRANAEANIFALTVTRTRTRR